jgi:hypothetical protein
MTTTTRADLSDAWDRLIQGLEWLESQPDGGKIRAAELRTHLHTHLGRLTDSIAGKSQRCPIHRTSLAHNCRECRSERIATPEYRPNPIADIDARVLGEGAR